MKIPLTRIFPSLFRRVNHGIKDSIKQLSRLRFLRIHGSLLVVLLCGPEKKNFSAALNICLHLHTTRKKAPKKSQTWGKTKANFFLVGGTMRLENAESFLRTEDVEASGERKSDSPPKRRRFACSTILYIPCPDK